jgi:hypothetical protein
MVTNDRVRRATVSAYRERGSPLPWRTVQPLQAMRRRRHQGGCSIDPSVGGAAASPTGEMFQEILCTEETR